jgi:hypothetical protein
MDAQENNQIPVAEPMLLSLGPVGDLLWRRFPELRAQIYEMVRERFEYAIEHDSEPHPPLPMFLWILFRREYLVPAIRSAQLDRVRKGLSAMRDALSLRDGPPPWGLWGTALYDGVLEAIEPEDLAVLRAAHPAAVEAIKNAFDLSAW